jgi:hypothetical protein
LDYPWACLLKQQTSLPFIVWRQRKTNFRFPFLFAENKRELIVSIFHCKYILKWQQIYRYRYIYISTYIFIYRCFKWKMEAQVIFLNLFTVCSSCKRKFVVCLSGFQETNGTSPFVKGLNRLNGLNGLGHLCLFNIFPQRIGGHTVPYFPFMGTKLAVLSETHLFMHSVYNNYRYCNETLSNIWTKNEHQRTEHNLRNVNDFLSPQPRIELFRKFPAYLFASTWNSLGDLKFQPNPITFKLSLENELLNELNEA